MSQTVSFVECLPVTNVFPFRRIIYFQEPPPFQRIYSTEDFPYSLLYRLTPLILQSLFCLYFSMHNISMLNQNTCIHSIYSFKYYFPIPSSQTFFPATLFVCRYRLCTITCIYHFCCCLHFYFKSTFSLYLLLLFNRPVYYDPVGVVYHIMYVSSFPVQILSSSVHCFPYGNFSNSECPFLPTINFYLRDNFLPIECLNPFQTKNKRRTFRKLEHQCIYWFDE